MVTELSSNDARPHIVIVGGGFGGVNAAKELGNSEGCRVTMIDRRNHHLFQPLLYQVAMAGLDPSDIASPIRTILSRYENTSTLLGDVTEVNLENRCIHTESGCIAYDYLILACGAGVKYFGHDGWEPFAPGLKTIPQATEIRRRVLSAFERAEGMTDTEEQSRQLTFVIVGGGPTGVELAGAISEMANKTLRRDFKNIDPASARVVLIEGGDRVLSSFDTKLSDYAKKALETLGVQVRLGEQVSEISHDGVLLGQEWIPSATVIWAAGVKPSSLGRKAGLQCDRSGRVLVEDSMAVPNHSNVFVIGDMAAASDVDGKPLPGVAPVAVQQGRYVGKLIRDEIKDGIEVEQRKPFRYFDKGQMATIGRRRAVLQSGKLRLTGTIAWLGWLFIHIVYLNGMRNRLFVFLSWAWSYVLFSRGARLIVSKDWRQVQQTGT
ncbi:MAG: NAD(P)/FAD-dependent oxidoreductase [Planctomycetota bacterium]